MEAFTSSMPDFKKDWRALAGYTSSQFREWWSQTLLFPFKRFFRFTLKSSGNDWIVEYCFDGLPQKLLTPRQLKPSTSKFLLREPGWQRSEAGDEGAYVLGRGLLLGGKDVTTGARQRYCGQRLLGLGSHLTNERKQVFIVGHRAQAAFFIVNLEDRSFIPGE